MRPSQDLLSVVQINCAFDESLDDPDALLDRYSTLTGWSEALVAAGAGRVTVFQGFRRQAKVTRKGIDYIFHDADVRSARSWAGQLHRIITDVQPDVAHFNGLIFPAQTWLVRRLLPVPSSLLLQDHASLPPGKPRASIAAHVRQAVRRRALGVADGFLFSVANQAEAWRQARLIAPGQQVYEVMESSTTLQPLPRAAAREATGVHGVPAVLWVGRLNGNKDPLAVLAGFEISAAQLPDATLTMIHQSDDLLPAVRERIQASEVLRSRVRLVGAVPHDRMPAFYSAADVFVLGSHHEGSGYALIEATACGLVPVVTDIPTFRAITAGGSVGALWAPGNSADCARALVQSRRLARSDSRALVAAHFERVLSWAAIGRQAMWAYGDAAARRRARAPDRCVSR